MLKYVIMISMKQKERNIIKKRSLRFKNALKVGYWELDLVEGTLYWSDEIFVLFELDKNNFEATYESFLNIIHPDDREAVEEAYQNSLKDHKDYEIKHRIKMDDGRIKWVKEECTTEYDENGKALVSFGVVSDISNDVYYEQKLKNSEKLLSNILNSTLDLIFYKDKDFKYLGCNDSFEKFVGMSKEELVGHDDFELFSEDMASLFREMDIKMLKKNEVSSNYEWITYKDGTKRYMYVQKIPFNYKNDEIGILGIARDVSELYNTQQMLKQQAIIDELTNAYNRKFYNDKVDELLSNYNRYKRTFSIAMIDIDDFKKINDSYGHQKGDEVLIELVKIIKSIIRTNDFLTRIGGEEFVVLLPETSLKDSLSVVEKIRSSIQNTLNILENQDVTISIGVTEVQADDTEDIMFKRVDELLYKSKKTGKNKITF